MNPQPDAEVHRLALCIHPDRLYDQACRTDDPHGRPCSGCWASLGRPRVTSTIGSDDKATPTRRSWQSVEPGSQKT